MIALRIANSLAITGATVFALADACGLALRGDYGRTGRRCSWSAPAWRARSPSRAPSASIRGRSGPHPGLYGFVQMGYGVFCTVVVETWHPGAVFPVATVLLGSALVGQVALSIAVRRG